MRQLRQGHVDHDGTLHAFLGMPPRALCGAGVLVTRLAGWFDRAQPTACPQCVEVIGPDDE